MKWYAAFQRFRQTACIFQFSTLVLPCPDSKCRVVNPTHCTARSLLAKRAKKERSSYVCPQTLPLLLHSNGERDTCSRTCILRGSCLHRVYRLTANACSSTIVCQFGRQIVCQFSAKNASRSSTNTDPITFYIEIDIDS